MPSQTTSPESQSSADDTPPSVAPTSNADNSSSTLARITTNGSSSDPAFNVTGTAQPSTGDDHSPGMPGGVIALLCGLLLLGVAIFCVILYLKRTGRLYKMVPFKPLGRYRRSSTSSSRGPLDLEDDRSQVTEEAEHGRGREDDSLPRTRDGNMFTIDDYETETVDLDTQSRGTNDEYYYDEVFGKSSFEDEATNASMRQLYLAGGEDDDEMFDVDAIVSSITGAKSKSTKT